MKQKAAVAAAAALASASAAKRSARMPGKPRKREMKKIENKNSLMVTFSKRRKGLFKKAGDLCTLCDAQVAVITFSPHGKPYTFAHPSVDEVIDRYQGKDRGGRNPSFPQETTNRVSDSTMQPLAKEKESMKLDLVAELKKELKDELKQELREELKGELQEGMMKELEQETGAARARVVELEKEEWMALHQSQKQEEDKEKEKEKEKEKKKEEEKEEEGLFFIKHKLIEEMSPEELETFKAFLEGNRERVNLRLDEHKNRTANTIDFLGVNGSLRRKSIDLEIEP